MLAFTPGELSTIAGPLLESGFLALTTKQFNFADLPCPPASVMVRPTDGYAWQRHPADDCLARELVQASARGALPPVDCVTKQNQRNRPLVRKLFRCVLYSLRPTEDLGNSSRDELRTPHHHDE